jgi:predicted RND superfamily exporter protein
MKQPILENLAAFAVHRRRMLVIVWAVAALAGAAVSRFVGVNYDLSEYLPDSMSSKIGADEYRKQFGSDGVALLMTGGLSQQEAGSLEEWMESLAGVSEVLGYSDVADSAQPEWFTDPDLARTFLRGEHRLFVIRFAGASQDAATVDALLNIRERLEGRPYALGAEAAFCEALISKVDRELPIYSVIAVAALFFVVLLAMQSFVEPFLLLIATGAAILVNMGTNLVLGEISMISNAAAPLLQLAVSMDYAIFLLHRYHQEKEGGLPPHQAMARAVRLSFAPISASALTTVAGFVALLFMRYMVGDDLGIVLAKGVLLSILSAVTLLPGLILGADRLIERTRHRVWMPGFSRLGVALTRFRYAGLLLVALLAIPSFFAQRGVTYLYSVRNSLYEDAQVNIDDAQIEERFDRGSELILLIPNDDPVRAAAFGEALREHEAVRSVSGFYDSVDPAHPDFFIPSDVRDAFLTDDGRMAVTVTLATDVEDAGTHEAVDALRALCERTFPGEWSMTGPPAVYRDLAAITGEDFRRVTLFSIILIGAILLISFRSLSLPLILVVCIESAIWINVGASYFAGEPLFFITSIIINAVQLGASVDYAILFTSRYRENLASVPDRRGCLIQTFRDTGRSILTSALTLFAATSTITLISTIRTTNEIMKLMARGCLMSMGTVFLMLPALLTLLDPVIRATTWRWPGRAPQIHSPQGENGHEETA